MTILSASGQDRETVQGFVEKYEAIYPVLYEAQSGAYSTGGVPSAYLIAGDGTVVWQGHPGSLSEDMIETELKKLDKKDRVSTWAFTLSRQLPEMPASMTGVEKLLEKMSFGAALKKVEATLPKLEGSEKEAGEAVRAWIAKNGETGLEQAAGLVRDNQIYKAFLKYEEVEGRFKGHALAKQAKDAAGALKKDKVHKNELKASEKFEKIKKEMRDEKKAEDKLACLKPLLSKKLADTLAGKEAAKMAAELEKQVGK
jgi:hypothetical protein